MDPSERMVVVRVFPATIEADLAASWLEAASIESIVQADDAGGVMPFMQVTRGVKLLVREADEERAKEVLDSSERELEEE